jgi:phage replication initiation protein
MTVPKKLVFDAGVVKAQCEERRVNLRGVCILDWIRYTVQASAVVLPIPFAHVPTLFGADRYHPFWLADIARLLESMRDESGEEAAAIEKAFYVANEVCDALGPRFRLGALAKGHDFYKHRIPLVLNDEEVGAVMCWSSSDGYRQRGQRDTINVNLHGAACTFGDYGWEKRIYHMGKRYFAVLTTVHLAVDFFDGIPGGMERVHADYLSGVWDHLGKRPKIGDINWLQGHSRSLYFGAKNCGKQTNIYEKGDQLYGADEARERGIKWTRAELRLGNKLRILDWDILLRPSDFFAGASEAHHAYLLMAVDQAGEIADVSPQNLPCNRPDALMQVEAEAARVVRWVRQTAGASLATLFNYLSDADLGSVIEEAGVPRRLKRFSPAQLKVAFEDLTFPGLMPVVSPA